MPQGVMDTMDLIREFGRNEAKGRDGLRYRLTKSDVRSSANVLCVRDRSRFEKRLISV